MNYSLFLLILLLALAIVLGLIKPSIVIYWGAKNRKQVITVYGLAILLTFIFFVLTIDKDSKSKDKENDKLKDKTLTMAPYASITYDVSCTGSNKQGVDLFNAFSPLSVSLYYSGDKFRMLEKGGTSGNIIADFNNNKIFFLDSLAKTATKATCTDMEKEMQDVKMRKLMPTFYRAELKETTETLNICGFKCKKYKLLKSGFVKAYAKAVVWATNEIILKPLRFDFQTKNSRILTPLPLQVGIDGGTILKMEVNENNVIVTYTAVSVSKEKPADNLFVLPDKYQIKE